MYGRGSIEDAKELQASFRQQNPPRHNNGGRGRDRGNGPSFQGNGGQDRNFPARSAGGSYPTSSMPQGRPVPATQYTPAGEKRIASSERDHDSKRMRNYSMENTNQANYPSGAQVSSQPYNSGMSSNRRPVSGDLMEFEEAGRRPRPATTSRENIPAGTVRSSVFPASPSILDTKGEDISQPVLRFTTGNEAREARQEDVPKRPRPTPGLDASRWNTQNTQSRGRHREPKPVDDPPSETRRPASRPGTIVTSGLVSGLGLADSRWSPFNRPRN
ncbi:hypothetical protein F5Y05DRAFT_8494 [Hypoxylon sp. FL0543]|nr:hypothetical protein F5Y05DRAFT_8494 [Hypoxylon sp. FL0543]